MRKPLERADEERRGHRVGAVDTGPGGRIGALQVCPAWNVGCPTPYPRGEFFKPLEVTRNSNSGWGSRRSTPGRLATPPMRPPGPGSTAPTRCPRRSGRIGGVASLPGVERRLRHPVSAVAGHLQGLEKLAPRIGHDANLRDPAEQLRAPEDTVADYSKIGRTAACQFQILPNSCVSFIKSKSLPYGLSIMIYPNPFPVARNLDFAVLPLLLSAPWALLCFGVSFCATDRQLVVFLRLPQLRTQSMVGTDIPPIDCVRSCGNSYARQSIDRAQLRTQSMVGTATHAVNRDSWTKKPNQAES